MRAYWFVGVALAVGFAGGWASRPKHAVAAPAPSASADGAAFCKDELAMAANANLTEQVIDYRHQLRTAQDVGAPAKTSVREPFAADREDAARMAAADRLRVRLPCASPQAMSRLDLVGPAGPSGVQSARHNGIRAEAALILDYEIEAIQGAYLRTHEKTWKAMREHCPVDARPGERTDADRIQWCRTRFFDATKPTMRETVREVAAARVAGKTLRHPSSDEAILMALASSSDVLYTEMSNAVGHDTAKRAIELGVVCIDEIVFHAPRIVDEPPIDVD